MELSVKNSKGNKQFEELYNDAAFVLLLVEITNNNTYKEWMSFFHLYEKKSLEVLAKTSIDGKGMPLTSQMMKLLLNDEKLLPEEIISHVLFSGDSPRVFKIIGDGIQLPGWLSDKIEKFLKRIDPEKLFSINQTRDLKKDGHDYRAFPFGELLKNLEKVKTNSPPNDTPTERLDRLNALVTMKKYATNIPDLFEIDEFEKNIKFLKNWGVKENTGFRKVMIDYLAIKVKEFEDEEGGYDKAHGKFILLLLSLNHPEPDECFTYLNEKKQILFDVHFKFIPKNLFENGEESKSNLVYSMLKNKWVNLRAFKMKDAEFLKVKRIVGNRFRSELMPIAKIYNFFGIIFKGEDDKKYQNGRFVAVVLFFLIFFIPPFLYLIFTGKKIEIKGYLTGFELLHCISFGLVASLWGCSDFFSKANYLGKPEVDSRNMYNDPETKVFKKYRDWYLIWVTVRSIFGVGLSVFFCFAPRFSLPFYAILFIEAIWFTVYMWAYKDPIEAFLTPSTQS
jgi:hypothetical protein